VPFVRRIDLATVDCDPTCSDSVKQNQSSLNCAQISTRQMSLARSHQYPRHSPLPRCRQNWMIISIKHTLECRAWWKKKRSQN
jgi:hypothetical protein